MLKKAVNDALAGEDRPPDVLIVAVACDVSRKAEEGFHEYARRKGIKQPILWAKSTIEAKLYSERPELVFIYFGIDLSGRSRSRERTIQRNIALKKRLTKDFAPAFAREVNRKVVIRSIDDSTYPDVDAPTVGISSWFTLEVYGLYFNGLEFFQSVVSGVLDREGKWAILPNDVEVDEEQYTKRNFYRIMRIPFRNIVDYDMDGDEFDYIPHIFCTFSEGGEPYEGMRYVLVDKEIEEEYENWHPPLDGEDQFDYLPD